VSVSGAKNISVLLASGILASAAVLAVYYVDRNREPSTDSGGAGSAVCGPVTSPPKESAKFTSLEFQRGFLSDLPISADGTEGVQVPAPLYVPQINRLPERFASLDSDGGAYQYYFNEPLTADIKRSEFQANGGIELAANKEQEGQDYAAAVLEREPERAVPVQIGDSDGVLIWADPEFSDDMRMHLVIWDQDGYVYSLTMNADAEAAIETARSVSCGL
jgi:hypothetical protein